MKARSSAMLVVSVIGALIVVATSPTLSTAQSELIPQFDAACQTENPFFITTCFALGVRDSEPAIVAFHDTPDDSEHYVLADYGQVGSTFGVAFDGRRRLAYAAAFHKRSSPFGPGGPGMIYRLDLAAETVEPWLDVPDAGTDHHDPTQNYIPDRLAEKWPGKTSLGDIDITDDGRELFVVNLENRKILRYATSDASLIGEIQHGASELSWADAEARPFALKVWQDKLYHGVVRDASRSRQQRDLWAYIYESELDGSNMRNVLAFRLDYLRGQIPNRIDARFLPWRDDARSIAPRGMHDHAYIYPMPMLVDIEFGDNEEMILGIRDRIGDMSLYDRNRNLPRGELSGHPFGDILLAERDGDAWTIEPFPEHFNEDAGGGMNATGGFHIETGFGGLARVEKANIVVNNAVSPIRLHSGGTIWFDIEGGGDTARETLYDATNGRTNFGKANGLGDLEILCGEAPPTPTPTASATATSTPTITPSPTPPDTATTTSTPTPAIYRIYLPFTNKDEYCPKDAFYTDVVLVLDRSTSMLRAVEPGGAPKNEAAIDAAMSFVGNLDFTPDWRGRHDQVAVVGFNDLAWIESDLSNDPAVALAALDRIRGKTQEGTRLDLAFTWGQKPLDGPMRRPENRPVIIMLTDGLPNRVPFGSDSPYPGSRRQEDSVLMAVDAVKSTGTRVYTVGLGTPRDILPWLLIDCASERWMYHYAPRPEELAGIYGQIARTFDSCDPKPAPTPCSPEFQHADVVLVLDMSTSMYRTTRTGRAKYEAAISAAHAFVAQLDLERDGWGRRDQVGIVGFNGVAWTSIGLGDDRGAIDAAIDRLEDEIKEGTRLDLALAEGQRVYEVGERLQPNTPVLILLTDGLPNQVPFGPGSPHPECERQECTVLKFASEVKSKGTRVYTIGLGLGDDVLRPLLENVATDPSMYYHAPDGEDLEGIYRQIAGRLSDCP